MDSTKSMNGIKVFESIKEQIVLTVSIVKMLRLRVFMHALVYGIRKDGIIHNLLWLESADWQRSCSPPIYLKNYVRATVGNQVAHCCLQKIGKTAGSLRMWLVWYDWYYNSKYIPGVVFEC